ncbi:acetylglutamate kinase [Dongshaea marina]|uniref:acetylglutamate kinase n=1 Tax=Dongshaea marina TaxID=2047966 RepID=UPI000D3EA10B|nr:acetylglutamate kinase [Dongshaea marina]
MQLKPLVIKIGGALLDSQESLEAFFKELSILKQRRSRAIVLVHGAGPLIDDWLKQFGLNTEKKSGLRITPKEHLPVVIGALAGVANKSLMAQAIRQQLPTVGLTLSDAGLCNITPLAKELGQVGQACGADPSLLHYLLNRQILPIISSIGINAQGEPMNINADDAAVAIARMINAELWFLSEPSGVLGPGGNTIAHLSKEHSLELIESGAIHDGMAIKVKAALRAARDLRQPVRIGSWRHPFSNHPINPGSFGTLVSTT